MPIATLVALRRLADIAGIRPGGRTARTRAAVLEATVAVLAARGYETLTVERVASRAGVHKTTLYRRWGGKVGLVIDAVETFAARQVQLPDTGSVDEDLRRWAHSILATLTGRESGAVERAVERGQLPPGTDAAEVIKQLGAPLYYRLFVIEEPLTAEAADLAAAAAVAAARAGVFVQNQRVGGSA